MARQVIQQTVVTDAGDVIANAQVTIRKESDNSLVALYDAKVGGGSVSNPLTTDAEGFYRVYADAPNEVYIQATGAGGDVEFRNIELNGTAATQDIATTGTPTSGVPNAALGFWGVGVSVNSNIVSDLSTIGPATLSAAIAVEGTEFGFSGGNRPVGLLAKGPFNTRWGFIGVTDQSILEAVIANSTGQQAKLHHTGNANFNEFGADGVADFIADGAAESTSVAVFTLPVNRYSSPTSISVTGTFAIRAVNGNTPKATAISTVQLAGNVGPGWKGVTVYVSGLSGLVGGEPLRLYAESSSSKITVN